MRAYSPAYQRAVDRLGEREFHEVRKKVVAASEGKDLRGQVSGKVTPEYSAYANAKARCANPNHPSYPGYGGRGIEFRFFSFNQFLLCIGNRPTGLMPSGKAVYSLDRYPNPNGHYEVGNVRWATQKQQCAPEARRKPRRNK
jgi:hypothetical protein